MVAMQPARVWEASGHTTSSIFDVEVDTVERLRRVLVARDVAAWNFDFETSTPLQGRYEWQQVPGHVTHVVAAPRKEPTAVRSRRCRRMWKCSARRRLVFDDRDSALAEKSVGAFLRDRLAACRPSDGPQIEQSSVFSMVQAAASSDDSRQCQNVVISDIANCEEASSAERRTSSTVVKRTTSARDNSAYSQQAPSKISGKAYRLQLTFAVLL